MLALVVLTSQQWSGEFGDLWRVEWKSAQNEFYSGEVSTLSKYVNCSSSTNNFHIENNEITMLTFVNAPPKHSTQWSSLLSFTVGAFKRKYR